VIDADDTRVADCLCKDGAQRAISKRFEFAWRKGREVPVLPLWAEVIWRCADGYPLRNGCLFAPAFGTVTPRSHGKIKVQAKRHSSRLAACLGVGQLDRGDPLQPHMKIEAIDRRRVWIGRPIVPVGAVNFA
jgi:hypothetical protein